MMCLTPSVVESCQGKSSKKSLTSWKSTHITQTSLPHQCLTLSDVFEPRLSLPLPRLQNWKSKSNGSTTHRFWCVQIKMDIDNPTNKDLSSMKHASTVGGASRAGTVSTLLPGSYGALVCENVSSDRWYNGEKGDQKASKSDHPRGQKRPTMGLKAWLRAWLRWRTLFTIKPAGPVHPFQQPTRRLGHFPAGVLHLNSLLLPGADIIKV